MSHFGADELYLECSVKFPKNMVSSPIELINKTPPFRGSGSELGLPHLLTFFHSSTAPRATPPLGCTSARSQAPPTRPGYVSKLPSPSPALVEGSGAAAPVGDTALGLQSSKKFSLAQHARHTLSRYVPCELEFASGRCQNGTAGRPHAPAQQPAHLATPSRPSTAAHHPWRGQVGSRLRWKKDD